MLYQEQFNKYINSILMMSLGKDNKGNGIIVSVGGKNNKENGIMVNVGFKNMKYVS
jgi:hypothetical protein